MSIIVGIRNLILRILFRIMRPVIFLMDPEQAHYSMKRIGVFLGSNFITRAFQGKEKQISAVLNKYLV